MDDDRIAKNIASANAVANQYGYEVVPVREMYEVFDRLSDLRQRGFEMIKAGLYGKQIGESITHVVKLMAWKGGIYSLGCGVSLSFMPHAWDPKLLWHKGFKAARLDLFETKFEMATEKSVDRDLTDIGSISVLHGGRYMYLTCLRMTTRNGPEMWKWFERVGTVPGILDTALAQENSPTTYGIHHPSPKLVAIFALARLGRADEAKASFREYPIEWETEIGRNLLEKGLDDVISGRRV